MPDPVLKLFDLVARRGAQLGVEVGQRLVEQEHGRVAHQRTRQGDALALAAGKLARPAIEQMLDAEQLRRPFDLDLDLGARDALVLSGKAMLSRIVKCG